MEYPDGVIEFVPDPVHFPFESRWFDSSVGPVHYIDEGHGPTLLLHARQPRLVVPLPQDRPRTARRVPVRRSRLPGLRPVGASERLWTTRPPNMRWWSASWSIISISTTWS